jgi:hypothetical protein
VKINVEMLRALCANVDRMVEQGRLPERMKGVTKLALAGEHNGFVDIVQRAMMNPDGMTDERLDELLAQPIRPLKRDANRFASRPPWRTISSD